MHARTLLPILVLSASVASAQPPPPLQHHHETGQPPQKLGQVSFATSCDPKLGPDFNRAVALLHSFWFGASAAAFTAIAEKDPSCGMAWWGVAMSRWGNPFAPARPPAALKEGGTAIAKAVAAGAKTDRERGLIQAAATLFADFETVDQRTRTVNYERAMERVAGQNPGDREIAAFYALSVNQTALPSDKTYAQQLKAAAILEPIFKALPDHPGAAHYLIHAYDHPALAERALPAPATTRRSPRTRRTRCTCRLTRSRVSATGRIRSTPTARQRRRHARRTPPPKFFTRSTTRSMPTCRRPRTTPRKKVIGELARSRPRSTPPSSTARSGTTQRRRSLPATRSSATHWKRRCGTAGAADAFPFIDAISHFARAIGAARSGNTAAAKADAQKLAELQGALRRRKTITGRSRWRSSTRPRSAGSRSPNNGPAKPSSFSRGHNDGGRDRQVRDLAGAARSRARAARRDAPRIEAPEGSADRAGSGHEERTEPLPHAVPRRPRRVRGGDQAKAKRSYASLVKMCAAGDGDRPELIEARKHGKS